MSYLILAFFSSFLVYSLLIFFQGETGIGAYGELDREKEKVEENLNELKAINSELNTYFNALRKDPEIIRIEARSLAYLGENETLVLGDFSDDTMRTSRPGAVIFYRPETDRTRENHFRLTALVVFSIVLLISFLIGLFRRAYADS